MSEDSLPPWNATISRAEALGGCMLRIGWSDGIEHVLDLAPFLAGFEALRPLGDEAAFRTVAVGDLGRSIVWSGGMDLAASTLRRLGLQQDAEQFRSWRLSHGLSQEAAGHAIGIGRRMVQSYETGSHPVPKTVKLALIGYDALHERAA